VSLFVWRLLNDRLPTIDNSSRTGVHNIAPHLCMDKCTINETHSHLLFDCHVACKLHPYVLS